MFREVSWVVGMVLCQGLNEMAGRTVGSRPFRKRYLDRARRLGPIRRLHRLGSRVRQFHFRSRSLGLTVLKVGGSG